MHLVDQLAHLDTALLGTVITQFPDPLPEPERAQVHAYLVLSHAVLEEFLELAFEEHFNRLCECLSSDSVPLECVRLAYAVAQYVPKDLVAYKKRNIAELIKGAGRKEFSQRLRGNNGLRSSNVESMCKLVGLHWEGVESALNAELLDLDTLGAKRGAASHLSPYSEKSTAIAVTDGPDDVRRWVKEGRLAIDAIIKYIATTVPSDNRPL